MVTSRKNRKVNNETRNLFSQVMFVGAKLPEKVDNGLLKCFQDVFNKSSNKPIPNSTNETEKTLHKKPLQENTVQQAVETAKNNVHDDEKFQKIPWNDMECAILLEACLEYLKEPTPFKKTELICRVSKDLRQMAINEGMEIQDKFRNENGIAWQMQIMLGCLTNGDNGIVRTTKAFDRIIMNFKEQPENYYTNLSQAKSLTNNDFVVANGITKVMTQYFGYGLKVNSIRDVMRFRKFAEEMKIELPKDDDILKTLIIAAGVVIGDRVYCKSTHLPQELRNIVSEVFATGVQAIYYESLYNNKSEWMTRNVITSEEMLKEYLQKYIPECIFSKKFFVKGEKKTEKEIVTSEIKRVWGSAQIKTVDELSSKLQYIPLDNLLRVISGNDNFVLVSEGTYLLLDNFYISESEKAKIMYFVEHICEESGFVSLNNLNLDDLQEEYYELTPLAIYKAVYKKLLSDKYYLNGKIITKDRDDLNVVALLKQYIMNREECKFDELYSEANDLVGETNRQYIFQTLYDSMVRVDRNRFVTDILVDFDVAEIDNILADFVTDKFIAIKDITTFVMFPACGYTWNHYLLESYCYKYSKKYSLHIVNFNDKNAGIIAEKGFHQSYMQMLSIALVRANVELTPDIIGPYLFNTGYTAKSKYAQLDEIAKLARKIQGER